VTGPRKPSPLAIRAGFFALLCVVSARLAVADDAASAPSAVVASPAPEATPPPPAAEPDDLEVDKGEPDFGVIVLPTNLRLPRHKLAFRLTHRFTRPLGRGDFSDLLADFFGFDGGAQIGLGLRFGLFSGTQLTFYRLSDRTIQFTVQQELVRQSEHPIGLSLVASVEGLDNFSQDYSPALSLVLSRKLGSHGAVYAVPAWVGNTNINAEDVTTDDSTLVLGLGARLLVSDSVALVGEYHPRLAGYKGDRGSGDRKSLVTFGIEKRVGGHAFQLNFSNDLGTTPAQTARGQQGVDDWFIGFNITRKFY
jgi:uncharacterized beta barrel domain-containing protein DUF5777